MSLLAPSFDTGSYTVTRRSGTGTTVDGHYTAPGTSTLVINASVQPLSGRALRDLKEGARADDTRWLYTNSALYTVDQGHDTQDVVTIEGESYRVIKVEHFTVLSGHYRITVERTNVP